MTYTRVYRSASPPNSPSPVRDRRSRSISRSRKSRSRSQECEEVKNPGNNLFVTGLSTRVTTADLEKYFAKEGKVVECHIVTDPRSKESRGFAFITMDTVEEAEGCIRHLHRSVLEGRLITVEKAKRKRGRTPTPGSYCGVKDRRGHRRSVSNSPGHKDSLYLRDERGRRSRSRSPYRRRTQVRNDFQERRRDLS